MEPANDSGVPPLSGARTYVILALVVSVVIAAAWGFVATLPFTGADVWPILAQGKRALDDPSILFTERYLEGAWEGARFWRPGVVALAAFQWASFGMDPMPYHVMRLVLLLVTAMLVGRAVSLRGGAPRVAFAFGAIFYVLHPVQAETIPAVARDADTMIAIAMTAAIVFLSQAREARRIWPLVLGLLAALVAPTFKEPGLLAAVLGVVALEPWRRRDPGSRRAIVGSLVLGVGLLAHVAYRLWLLGGTVGRYEFAVVELGPVAAASKLFQTLFDHQSVGYLWPLALVALGLVFLARGMALRVPETDASGPSRAWIRLRHACWWWLGVSFVVFVNAPRFRTRYAEALLVPLVILLSAWIVGLFVDARRVEAGRARALNGAAAASAVVAVLLLFGSGNPLIWSYPQWKIAGDTGERVLEGVLEAVEAAERDGRPARVLVGTFRTEAVPEDADRFYVGISPFPYKIREPQGTFEASLSTVVVMGKQSVRGYLQIFDRNDGLIDVIQRGATLDVTAEDAYETPPPSASR
jgi:hypothetical protein